MRVLFKEDGRPAYTVDGVCAIPDGMAVAEVPDALQKHPLNYLRLSAGVVVVEVSDDPTVQIVDGEIVPTPNAAKAKKWSAIKTERDRRTDLGGVKVDGRWFDSDTKSALRYKYLADLSAAMGAGDDTVIRAGWRPMDVEEAGEVSMTYGLLKKIMMAGIVTAMEIDAAAQAHKAAMEASADPSAYDFSEDWPESFEC